MLQTLQKNDGTFLLQGHIYSLGSTLSAALNFVVEPELEAELEAEPGEELQKLLHQMQEQQPEDRPLLEVQNAAAFIKTNRLRHYKGSALFL